MNMNAQTTAASSRKILLVDDNLVIQLTVTQALKNAGYQVFTASDISATLGIVRREKPDLILLDLSFPLDSANFGSAAQDGFFIVEWLRRTPEAAKIPIIIVSATEPAKYQNQVSDKGVIACFHKPLNHPELMATIQTALGGKA
jgi:CheY-like chemotaxis protein